MCWGLYVRRSLGSSCCTMVKIVFIPNTVGTYNRIVDILSDMSASDRQSSRHFTTRYTQLGLTGSVGPSSWDLGSDVFGTPAPRTHSPKLSSHLSFRLSLIRPSLSWLQFFLLNHVVCPRISRAWRCPVLHAARRGAPVVPGDHRRDLNLPSCFMPPHHHWDFSERVHSHFQLNKCFIIQPAWTWQGRVNTVDDVLHLVVEVYFTELSYLNWQAASAALWLNSQRPTLGVENRLKEAPSFFFLLSWFNPSRENSSLILTRL